MVCHRLLSELIDLKIAFAITMYIISEQEWSVSIPRILMKKRDVPDASIQNTEILLEISLILAKGDISLIRGKLNCSRDLQRSYMNPTLLTKHQSMNNRNSSIPGFWVLQCCMEWRSSSFQNINPNRLCHYKECLDGNNYRICTFSKSYSSLHWCSTCWSLMLILVGF